MYVPEEIPLTLIRRDPKRNKPWKIVDHDNITEEQLDDLRLLKDREIAASIEKEQRKQAELRLKKQAQMAQIMMQSKNKDSGASAGITYENGSYLKTKSVRVDNLPSTSQ